MSGIYKGIYKGNDKIVQVIKNGENVWQQETHKELTVEALGNRNYKMSTMPNKRYMVTLTDEDQFDIGTKQYSADIRNAFTRDKVIKFTAKTNETYFSIYRQGVSIVKIEEI